MKRWLISGLLLLLLLPIACAGKPPADYPVLTEQQVISRVQVYGVSYYLRITGGSVSPVGQWAAVYEGNGRWRVRGQVAKSYQVLRWSGSRYYYDQETSYHATTWIHTNDEIRLLKMED